MDYMGFFREICSIPHVSGHLDAIGSYLERFARTRGLDCVRDAAGNVLMRKDASDEAMDRRSPVVLQAHMDMVGVSADGRDMVNEPVRLVEDGDFLSADGSSLGADDGMGMAFILDVLSDDKLRAPKIQALFTTDEETGMNGINAFDFSRLSARHVINIDSENENEVVVSSAGGADEELTIKFNEDAYKVKSGCLAEISVSGLEGGHSGCDIDKGRTNALMALIRVLHQVSRTHDVKFVSLQGGSARNSIPTCASACVLLDDDGDFERFRQELREAVSSERERDAKSDPNFSCSITWRKASSAKCLIRSSRDLFDLLRSLPDGIARRGADLEPVTSLNFGIAEFDGKEGKLHLRALLRSGFDAERDMLANRIKAMAASAAAAQRESPSPAFSCFSKSSGDYGAWLRKADSRLLELFMRCHRQVYGREAKAVSTHGGLECGIFARKIKDCDLISIGPDIMGMHSVGERVSASSCGRVLRTLKVMLENWEL